MKNGGAAQNASHLGEGAGRRPGIDCLEEADFCRTVGRPLEDH